MGAVSWVRADVGVSSNTAPVRPMPSANPWMQRLGLSDDQSAKFQAAMDKHQTALRTLQQQMRAQTQKLQGLVQSKAGDKEILSSLSALKSDQKAIQDENDKFDDSLAGFLTPTQRATWAGMSGYGMMGGMMGPGMMHPWMNRPQPQGPGAGAPGAGQTGQPNPPPAGSKQP